MGQLVLRERVGGIEPPSSAWKADIIAFIQYPPQMSVKIKIAQISNLKNKYSSYFDKNQGS